MSTQTEIENLALLHLGSSIDLASFSNSDSDEAKSLRLLYEFSLPIMLRGFRWPFATKFKVLEFLDDNIHPHYAKAYRYPSDCKFFSKIFSSVRNDTLQSRVKFERGMAEHEQNTVEMIFTDKEEACGEYIIDMDDESTFDADFAMALSWQLAYYLAPSTTGGDPFKLQQAAFNNWVSALDTAMKNASNEEQVDEMPESEIIRARNTLIDAGRRPPNNTFFPSGSIIT